MGGRDVAAILREHRLPVIQHPPPPVPRRGETLLCRLWQGMHVCADALAVREARHADVPTFVEDTPVYHRKGHVAKDASCIFPLVEAEALDRTGVLYRGSFPVLIPAAIPGI